MRKTNGIPYFKVGSPTMNNLSITLHFISSYLKSKGILKSTSDATGYGQIRETDDLSHKAADGEKPVKEQKTYTGDDNCRGKCLHYCCCRCSKRYYTAWLCNFGFMITFGIRCNMTWAMLSMQDRHMALNATVHSPLHYPGIHHHHHHHSMHINGSTHRHHFLYDDDDDTDNIASMMNLTAVSLSVCLILVFDAPLGCNL